MSSLTLNESQAQQLYALNTVLEAAEPRLSKILTFDNFVNEAYALKVIESNMPESLRMDLHLDMILGESEYTLTEYYRSMCNGTNRILEAARKILPDSPAITESIESFKAYLGSLLNEEALALGMPVDSAINVDTAVSGGALKPRTGGGFWGTIKNLWNTLTEGGSLFGVVHLILDIIGIVGDWIIPGVGLVADILNAIIYACRGEWIMAAISLIAGIIIGWGDLMKGLRFAAKPAGKVLGLLAKEGGSKAAAETIAKLPAKEKGGVLKLLTGIFGNIGGVIGKATSLLGNFFQGFGKVSKWIPGLGGALKPIFDGLGTTLTKFGQKMSLCSANFKLATKASKKAAAASIDSTIKAGGDFVFDGPWVKVLNKEGKQVGKYPARQFDKISGEALADLTAKKAGSKEASKILYKSGKDVSKVSKTLENPIVQESMRKRAYTFITRRLAAGSARTFNIKNLSFFIGKQIYKIIFKSNWVDGANNKWSKREVEGHGNGALNDWVNDRIAAEKKESGAVYIPALMLDSQDQEVVDRVTKYQNKFANDLNQPRIINVVTNQYDKEGPGKEFEEFFDEVAKGKVTRGGKGDKIDHRIADELSDPRNLTESKKSVVKTISNFSDFK